MHYNYNRQYNCNKCTVITTGKITEINVLLLELRHSCHSLYEFCPEWGWYRYLVQHDRTKPTRQIQTITNRPTKLVTANPALVHLFVWLSTDYRYGGRPFLVDGDDALILSPLDLTRFFTMIPQTVLSTFTTNASESSRQGQFSTAVHLVIALLFSLLHLRMMNLYHSWIIS